MEISNSGGLYGKITIDALGKVHPETRNAALANMLELLNITENRYSGIPTMRMEFLNAGLPVPVFSVRHGEFKVIMKKLNLLADQNALYTQITKNERELCEKSSQNSRSSFLTLFVKNT